MKEHRRSLALLLLALFNSIIGLSVLFPILAPLGRDLHLSETQIGMFSTGYALMQFVLSPYWGNRSEVVGRRPVLITGIFGFAVGFLLFGAAVELGRAGLVTGWALFGLMLLTRLIGGGFSAATLPTVQAYVADLTGREERTRGMAMIGATFGMGVVIGPGIGALLAQLDIAAPIWFSGVVGLLNGVFVWARLPEPERHVHQERTPMAGVARKAAALLAVAVAASLAAVAMEQTVAFLYQDRLHLDSDHTTATMGAALFLYGLVAVATQGGIVRRLRGPPTNLVRAGLPLSIAGLLVLVFSHTFWTLTAGFCLQAFGQGLAMPGITAAVSLAVDDSDQGAVAGLNSSAQSLGRVLGPLIGTSLYATRPELPYLFSAAILVIALSWLLVGVRRPVPAT